MSLAGTDDDPDERRILCGTHGVVERAYLCGHLFARGLGSTAPPLTYFVADHDDAAEDELEEDCVWCAACDAMLQQEGDWTDAATAFADVHVVCGFCLAKFMAENVRGDAQD